MKMKCLQDIPINQLAERVGSTPFYVYDRSAIKSRVSELRQQLSQDISIHYAIKANPMPALICFIADLVDGFDVASAYELAAALNSGKAANSISFAGPGKTDTEIRQALAAQVLLHVESKRELQRVVNLSQSLSLKARISLRVNPEFSMKSSGMKMGGGPAAFGIDAEEIPEVVKLSQQLGVSVEGLHFFSGSQILNAATLIENFEKTTQSLIQMKNLFSTELTSLSIGGGFGIPYSLQDQALNIQAVAKALNQQASKLKQNFPKAKLIIELGRYLVGEAGAFVAKVVDKKNSRGKTFVILDGGMNYHLAASGNLGQVIKRNYPMINASKTAASNREIVNVVGPLCTPLDTLATDMELAFVDIGDLIVIFQSGAYGLTASPQDFLSHEKIKEVLI